MIPATCEVWVDGIRYADGCTGASDTDPFALAGLAVTWGRESTVDQPEASTCTFTVMDPPGGTVRFDATVQLGSTVTVVADVAGQRVIVFGGRITDLSASFDEAAGSGVCDVVAADQLADLANRFVGDEPWPAEPLADRARRILTLAGVPADGLTVAPRLAALVVSRADVDRQPAAGLLAELAVTAGGVLWASWDAGGPRLTIEDTTTRASLYTFTEDVTRLLWRPAPGIGAGSPLTACAVLRDPVTWGRKVTDLITQVAVRWLEQTDPDPTERTLTVVNAAAESQYGARGLSIGTQLVDLGDAQQLASLTLAAHQPGPAWRVDGLTWDLGDPGPVTDTAAELAAVLLDGRTRAGHPVALTDLPYWTPTDAAVQLYIEGGTYTFDGGRWLLALDAAPATGLGGSLSYEATDPSIRYRDIDPTITFADMIGVGPRGNTGPAWQAMPDGLAWDDIPAGTPWSEDPR